MYKNSIFIFRRSLRLEDNIGLLNALKLSEKVIPIFIFTPEQLIKNPYKSDNAVQFMIESLEELNMELKKKKSKLFYFFGQSHEVIKKIIKNYDINAVFVNKDYTPYSITRDKKIENICKKKNIIFQSYEDILLQPIGSINTASGKSYQKYTPYYQQARKISVSKPRKNNYNNYISNRIKIKNVFTGNISQFYKKNNQVYIRGGTKGALSILKKIKTFDDYDKKKNLLTYQTTLLSAYIKFGCVSIRFVFYIIKTIKSKDLIRQLYWRDFYYNIAFSFPHVFKGPMKEKYGKIRWINNERWFEAWKLGKTGFPIVDACMRELNTTGYMHNRGRLIVSNFLVKILLIDWRKGEKYFATRLIDYDPCVNNGNWQWSSSSGADSQPYFRVFNPWLQSKKFDPQAKYIKKWVPELREINPKTIHIWNKVYKNYNGYLKPIVNYKLQREKGINLFSRYIFK
jgi:deoxyribodipyrimidine photo-lyase